MNTTEAEQPISPYLYVPAALYILHAFAVILFTMNEVPLNGLNAGAGSMVLIASLIIDFPLGIPVFFVATEIAGNYLGIAIVALVGVLIIGGVLWIWTLRTLADLPDRIRRNRERQRQWLNQCVACTYDLSGTPAATTCPECGHVISRPPVPLVCFPECDE